MNTETGEVKTIDDLKRAGLIGPDDKPLPPWIALLEDEARMVQEVGPSNLKDMSPEPDLSKQAFRRKYGCSRLEYALRMAK